jgi:hypothetical protein
MELINTFLEQAEFIPQDGSTVNARFRALNALSAKGIIFLRIGLEYLESKITLQFQPTILDSIVQVSRAGDSRLSPVYALIFRCRWKIRAVSSGVFLDADTPSTMREIRPSGSLHLLSVRMRCFSTPSVW